MTLSPAEIARGFEITASGHATAALLHGWTGSPAHFGPLALRLRDAGISTVAPLLAGHGTAETHMARTGWRDWVASALEPLERIDEPHIVGLSMGGLIGILIAAVTGIASLTTINSPQKVFNRRIHVAPLYRGSTRVEPGDEPEPLPPEVAPYAIQYRDTPVGTVAELRDLMKAARRALPRVTAPTLVVQSLADATVKPESAHIIYERLGSADKHLFWLERSPHVATLGPELDRLAGRIIDHIAASSSS